MSLKPVEQEKVQQTVQILLSYLDDDRNSTPNNMLEGIVSAKSLLRGIISGQLLVCQDVQEQAMPPELKAAIDKKAAKDAEDAAAAEETLDDKVDAALEEDSPPE